MGEYKRQHTITKAYLKGFAAVETPNTLWRYQKSDGSVERCNIDNATVKFYAYSYQNAGGQWNHAAEEILGNIESKAIPLLEKLKTGTKIADGEKYDLALFLASTCRRPAALLDHFRNEFQRCRNDPKTVAQFIENRRPELIKRFSEAEIQDAIAKARKGVFDNSIETAKAMQLQTWLSFLPKNADIIAQMHWQIWRSKKEYLFLTSDAPAYVRRNGSYDDPGLVGIARSDLRAELFFPISPACFLIAKHEPCAYVNRATKSRVNELNKLTIRMSYHHIFAGSRIESIQRLILQNNETSAPLPNLSALHERTDRKYFGTTIPRQSRVK